jgi:hypothetical protein
VSEHAPQHLVLAIEIPAVFTADIVEGGRLREYVGDFDSESDFILNSIGEPGIVRVRMEISGDKDSEVVEVWGSVREARLVEPSRGYGDGPELTDEQLAEYGGHKFLRDEDACEWCVHPDTPEEGDDDA